MGSTSVKSGKCFFEPKLSLVITIMIAIMAAPLHAESVKITPIARWAGQTGKIGSGDSGYICNKDRLNEFWNRWAIAKPKPHIDFSTDLAVFYMGSGGPHLMDLSLEEAGNLLAVYVQTPTASRYPNYLIFTVSRHGIKSLNGMPVICAE
jgi:hypothetical protein